MPISSVRTRSATRQRRRSIYSLPRWQRLLIGLALLVIGLTAIYLIATWLPVAMFNHMVDAMSSARK
jgi:hypothetical protein